MQKYGSLGVRPLAFWSKFMGALEKNVILKVDCAFESFDITNLLLALNNYWLRCQIVGEKGGHCVYHCFKKNHWVTAVLKVGS